MSIRHALLTLAVALASASCCHDVDGVTMSCTCEGTDSGGNRVPVTIPSGGCGDGDAEASEGRSVDQCEEGYDDCACTCTVLGAACTYESCSG
jgi:hypothetical protein